MTVLRNISRAGAAAFVLLLICLGVKGSPAYGQATTVSVGVSVTVSPSQVDTKTSPQVVFTAVDDVASPHVNVAGVVVQINIIGPQGAADAGIVRHTTVTTTTAATTSWHIDTPISVPGTYQVVASYSTTGLGMSPAGFPYAHVTADTSTTLTVVAASSTPASGTTTPTTPTKQNTISIPNPLGNCNNATCLITRVIKSILGIVAVVATFMFVWGGVLMLTSGGNERQVTQAKETLVWAAIGIIVIIISWSLISFVLRSFIGTQ